jgi:hypothetical protein
MLSTLSSSQILTHAAHGISLSAHVQLNVLGTLHVIMLRTQAVGMKSLQAAGGLLIWHLTWHPSASTADILLGNSRLSNFRTVEILISHIPETEKCREVTLIRQSHLVNL